MTRPLPWPFLRRCRRAVAVVAVALLCLLPGGAPRALACTSGLFGASATRDGRPLLWKHRDTSAVDNKVEYIPASPDGGMAYVALFNASDRDCLEAWGGFNEAGLAIMNTASYNLKADSVPEREMDREGLVMTMALRNCRTVGDFALLLDSLPRPMGVEANFGLFDASGTGAFFETTNDRYIRHDLTATPGGDWMVRTNYSHAGRPCEGFGFLREREALRLLEPVAGEGLVSPEFLTETVSRSFHHALLGEDYLLNGAEWTVDQDFIPRYKSSAVIVIEGLPSPASTDGGAGLGYVMWTGLGYPPCSEITAAECREGGVDPRARGLLPDGHSELSDLAKARRDEVFPIHYGNGDKYIFLPRLSNADGTGYLQVLVPQNLEFYRRWREKRERR